jgi:ferritin-like metal-binding protein YciE
MATMTTDSDRLEAAHALVVSLLNEAHATEAALVTTLAAHISMTPGGSYRGLLEKHLDETRGHARAIERRLADIGGGAGLVPAAVGLVETVVGQVLALSKGPIDLLRGSSREEKLLKNARDECATEALEIAHYDALEAAAGAVGDDKTVRLARSHRADEERMLAALRREIPGLATATVGERADGAGGAAGARNGELPIAGYDRLNAGQVIKRLERLSGPELDAVERYERAHRNRSTVLRKVEERRRALGRA